MAKRFIDTDLFDDEWFMNLPPEAKILWLYFITKCDHAGILKLNQTLAKVQTGIKDLTKVIEQLGNRIVTVNDNIFFVPKFIEYQYPDFPKSKVRQQASAIEILRKYDLIDNEGNIKYTINSYVTVNKELPNSYDNDNDNEYENEIDIDKKKEESEEKKDLSAQTKKPTYASLFDKVLKEEGIQLPEGFYELILEWLKYKSEKGQTYKETGLKNLIIKIINDSGGNYDAAKNMIFYSVSNNYAGLYKEKTNGKTGKTIAPATDKEIADILIKHFGNG